jgi:hypothetical protein
MTKGNNKSRTSTRVIWTKAREIYKKSIKKGGLVKNDSDWLDSEKELMN